MSSGWVSEIIRFKKHVKLDLVAVESEGGKSNQDSSLKDCLVCR